MQAIKTRIYCAVPPPKKLATICFMQDIGALTSIIAVLLEALRDTAEQERLTRGNNKLGTVALFRLVCARLKCAILPAIKEGEKIMGSCALRAIRVEIEYIMNRTNKLANNLRCNAIKSSRGISRVLAHFTKLYPQYKF